MKNSYNSIWEVGEQVGSSYRFFASNYFHYIMICLKFHLADPSVSFLCTKILQMEYFYKLVDNFVVYYYPYSKPSKPYITEIFLPYGRT